MNPVIESNTDRPPSVRGLPSIAPYQTPSPAEIPPNRVSWRPDPGRGVLLIHDLQEHFLSVFDRTATPCKPMLAHVGAIKRACQFAGVPVLYTAQSADQSEEERGLLTDMWGVGIRGNNAGERIAPEVAPEGQDTLFIKKRYSAFVGNELASWMQSRGRDQIYICGIYGHIGCQVTACDAFMRDIQSFVVRDAIGDFSREHHVAALTYVATRCGAVVSSDDLIHDIVGSNRRDRRAATVLGDLAELMGVASDEIAPEAVVTDLGVDSLRLMELAERWTRVFPDLTAMDITSCRTVRELLALVEGGPS
ncbi:MAG: isochorismatase family protein [Proteobacteria bacterium]|nr:isochorismatase family protein [Pseudomonadota bacterium]